MPNIFRDHTLSPYALSLVEIEILAKKLQEKTSGLTEGRSLMYALAEKNPAFFGVVLESPNVNCLDNEANVHHFKNAVRAWCFEELQKAYKAIVWRSSFSENLMKNILESARDELDNGEWGDAEDRTPGPIKIGNSGGVKLSDFLEGVVRYLGSPVRQQTEDGFEIYPGLWAYTIRKGQEYPVYGPVYWNRERQAWESDRLQTMFLSRDRVQDYIKALRT